MTLLFRFCVRTAVCSCVYGEGGVVQAPFPQKDVPNTKIPAPASSVVASNVNNT
jgi:hypothetical protein